MKPIKLGQALVAALLLSSAVAINAPAASAEPGAIHPTSYFPSEASLGEVPTYRDPSRVATSATGTLNGQDYDHYCVADWESTTILAGATSGQTTGVVSEVIKRSSEEFLAGNNGLLYMNQWWNGGNTVPYFRVVWATDFPTTNSKLVLHIGDNWTGGVVSGSTLTPYSTDPATLLTQLQIWSGASRFRTYDWSTYVLGLQNQAPYAGTDHYGPGPYTGVDEHLFQLNPDVVTTTTPGFNDPFYPEPNQYVPNLDPANPYSFVNNINYDPAARTITIDLGDQPADSMIVFGVSGASNNGVSDATDEAYRLTADFKATYPNTDPDNTVCYPVGVSWSKTDAETSALLAGSRWSLDPAGDTAGVANQLAVSDTTNDSNSVTGQFTTTTTAGLEPGNWTLRETLAPTGYQGSADTHAVRLDFANPNGQLGAITNSNEAPTITAPDVTIDQGAVFDLLSGVTGSDREDGNVTTRIVVTDLGGFDPNTPGAYTITYRVTDAGGKSTTASRVVTVVAPAVTPTPTPTPTSSATPTPSSPSPRASSPRPTASPSARGARRGLPTTGAAAAVLGVASVAIAGGAVAAALARRRSRR